MALHSRQAGQGEPLILLHGLFGSAENLGALARQLADTYAVYSVDLPNHGRSPHTQTMTLATMTQDLVVWMDQQGLAQAHLLGHSLGGKVAMELALAHPTRVLSLTVVDIAPVDYPPHHQAVFDGLLSLKTEALQSRGEADKQLQNHVPELAVRSFLLKNLDKAQNGGFSWRMNLPVIHQQYAQLISANRSDGVFNDKTLFIKGGNSDCLREAHRQDILSRFPKATVKVVPDTGHWLHAEKPELVAVLVKRFIGSDSIDGE